MRKIIDEINTKIGRYHAKLVEFECDLNQTTYIVYANLSDTPLDRLQKMYTEGDLSYFRLILHQLATADHHWIGLIECLNLTDKVVARRRVRKIQAEALISMWIAQGYLAMLGTEIGFGPKAMVEFDRYLATKFPNRMAVCRLCKEILFYVSLL